MKVLALVGVLVLAACSVSAPGGTEGLITGSPEAATASPIAEPSIWPPKSTDDPQYAPITSFTLTDGGRRIELEFVGAREYAPDDPCSAEYTGVAAVVDGILEVGVTQVRSSRPAEPPVCDAMGHLRSLALPLDDAFVGSAWRDLHGPYLHFLAPPDGLVELTGLPDGWELRSGRDVEESPTGRWERTYSPDASPADETRRLLLYQAFDGSVNVTGGTDESRVTVNGKPATLYRWPPNGELVLVWQLANDGLALVAYEQEFSTEELIALAESAVAPAVGTGDGTWGPLAVMPPDDGADTAAAGGTLRVGIACVYLDWPGGMSLLLWPVEQTRWNEGSRTITFDNLDGNVVTVGDGAEVVLGGGSGGGGEGAESGPDFVDRVDWIAPPHPSCALDSWWGVGAVDVEGT
jgi:hypothetical protein